MRHLRSIDSLESRFQVQFFMWAPSERVEGLTESLVPVQGIKMRRLGAQASQSRG